MTQEEPISTPLLLTTEIDSEVGMGTELFNQGGSQGFGGSAQTKTLPLLLAGWEHKNMCLWALQGAWG